MPPRRHPPESAALLLARVAPQVSRWVERSLATHEPPLTVAQYLALEQLDGGEVGATDLADGAAVSRSAVSQLLSSLEAAGLVVRDAAPDRRRRVLGLSSEGKRVLGSARRMLRARLGPLLAELPGLESDGLARSLGHLEDFLRGKAPPRRRPRPPAPPHRRR